MRCKSFEEIIADLDREGALDAVVRTEAFDHASRCSCCSRALAEARALDADLRLLADDTNAVQAPERLAHALRAARQAPPRRAPRAWLEVAATAALALVGLVLVAGIYLRRERLADHDETVVATASAQAGGDLFGYTPLSYGEPLTSLDGSLVIRVELSGASLAGLGWAGASPTDPVRADVIVGEDGVARAIRFVE